jgi:subtilisin family serine protease
MQAYKPPGTTAGKLPVQTPSDELRIALTFPRPSDQLGLTKFAGRPSAASVRQFLPDPEHVDRTIHALSHHGFRATARGALSVSVRGTRQAYERLFHTKLSVFELPLTQAAQFHSFYFPKDQPNWQPDKAIAGLLDDAYIQWPHIYLAVRKRGKKPVTPGKGKAQLPGPPQPNAKPPSVPNAYYLNVPDGVTRLLNVQAVHKNNITGKGVRVAMIDSGFWHSHPYFKTLGVNSSVVLAPGASNRETDVNGHGTGESTNIFSVAPDVTFIGIKVDNDSNPQGGASMLEGFQEALTHKPQVISVSMGYDLRQPNSNVPASTLPNSLKALEAEIQAAVASGIAVVFSAGNGHYSFPGQMPDVLSAGGVFVAKDGSRAASDYASAFQSAIYSGRSVPDLCGLVGMLPHADYIMFPIPPASVIDQECSQQGDGTSPSDGWGRFSGTSAAAPQLAGVCALLLQKNSALTPSDLKAILKRSAVHVATGHANPASDPTGNGEPANAGPNGATGFGLVDAMAAIDQA